MNTKAIVLHTLKYGDASVIVDMLTQAKGRVSFFVNIPKTSKGRFKKQYFQPLTILDVTYDHRERTSLQRLRDVRIATPFTSLPFDPIKLSISLFLAEFLYNVTRDEQSNIPLYQYVENSLLWLDGTQRSCANFHLVFMMRLSRFIGFYPNLEGQGSRSLTLNPSARGEGSLESRGGLFFDLREASFVTAPPTHPDFLEPAEAELIHTLMRMDYNTMHLFHLSRAERNRFTDLLLQYYRVHIPQMPELHSLSVVREISNASVD